MDSISPLNISNHTVDTSLHGPTTLSKVEENRVKFNQRRAPILREQGVLQARCRHVEACISLVFAIPHQSIRCTTRGKATVARARQTAMYLCHTSLALSLTQVGLLFARDRTTVGHACRLVEDLRDDRDFDLQVTCLERAVCAGSVEGLAPVMQRGFGAAPQAGVSQHG